MADRMPPPGMTVAIAVKPKGSDSGKMPPPGEMGKPRMGEDGKVSPEDAQVYRADQTCVHCVNYDPTSGDCTKVSGSFDPSDGCLRYFSAIGDDEPDEDDMDGESDNDAD